VAYTRIALLDEGCGGIGIKDIGVYYRSRDLPSGTWSEPQQVGEPTDSLMSLRVAGGSLHLLVIDPELNVFYETVEGATVHRYKVGESFGGAALRIGGDGRARIAYESANSLKFGVFTGAGFSTTTIPGTTNAVGPSLVLDAQNHAHVVWTRTNQGGGCAEPDPDPKEGMYYATDAGGTWRTTRFTKSIGEASLTVDVKTGRVHILFAEFADRGGLRYYTKAANGGWTAKRILAGRAFSPVLRLDPSTGTLLAAFVDDSVGHAGIYIMTTAGG
jgi:hypothetical protein